MKYKFIVKPPIKKKYKREFLLFKKDYYPPSTLYPPSHPKYEKIEEEFTEKEGSQNAKNLAKKAALEGFDRIIFVGGDGLLNEGVNGIMEVQKEKIPPQFGVGIIPTGSGNNFAKGLGIRNIQEAFKTIKDEKITLIDIGRANQRFFVNCFSVGFDALINKSANDLKEDHRFLPKNLSYLLPALKEIFIKIPVFDIKIKGETIDFKGKAVLLAITNSPSYGGIFKINPQALLDDGKLDLCLIKSVSKIRALFDILKFIKGKHTNLPEVKMLKFSSPLTIFSLVPLPWEVDGEIFEPKLEYKIKIFKRILPIFVPSPS